MCKEEAEEHRKKEVAPHICYFQEHILLQRKHL